MYIPGYYKEEELTRIKELINSNGFGILINQTEKRLWATHVPMLLEEDPDRGMTLIGHLSRANKQWQEFKDNQDVLVIFQGPDAYISSSWYNHENVPTWNYQAVHLYGIARMIGGDILKSKLSRLVDKYEQGLNKPVSMDRMSDDFIENEMRGIIGFEVQITEIEAVSKLSQNRDAENYNRILKGLNEKGDEDSLRMARIMKDRK